MSRWVDVGAFAALKFTPGAPVVRRLSITSSRNPGSPNGLLPL